MDPNREAIQRAQAALDRLDFKTGIEICNQVSIREQDRYSAVSAELSVADVFSTFLRSKILESNPSDPTQSLLLRSNGLERSGRIYDAVKDAETALEGQNTRQVSSKDEDRGSIENECSLSHLFPFSFITDSSQSRLRTPFNSPSSP